VTTKDSSLGARAATARALASLAVAVALGLFSPALAEPDPAAASAATKQAKAHFRAGTELYRQARYREAVAEFEAAHRLRPHGVVFYNLAQCHERLGDIPAALLAYHEYLRAVPDAEDRATVQAAISNLGARLAPTGLQQLLVYSDPPGAEVYVDGQPRGRTPLAALLPHGRHALTLEKHGHVSVTREALLPPDRALDLEVSLPRAEVVTAAPVVPSLRPSPPREHEALPAVTTSALSQLPEAQAARPRRWTWIAAGAAGAALATGIAYGLAARSAGDDLRRTQHDSATAQRLADSAASRSRTANVLYGVAGALGAGGVTLFVFEGRL
jgi:tetratricopeptide (TPR) repeat protein